MEVCKNPRKRDGQSKQTWNIFKKIENATGILFRLSPLLAYSCLWLPPQNLSFRSKIIETKDCRGPRISSKPRVRKRQNFWVLVLYQWNKGSQRIRLSETCFSEDFPDQNPCFHRFYRFKVQGLSMLLSIFSGGTDVGGVVPAASLFLEVWFESCRVVPMCQVSDKFLQLDEFQGRNNWSCQMQKHV